MTNTSRRGLGSPHIHEATKRAIQSEGGKTSSQKQDMKKLGRKGGRAAQQSGRAHKLTQEERSEGGRNSGGNFANDPQRARQAAMKRYISPNKV